VNVAWNEGILPKLTIHSTPLPFCMDDMSWPVAKAVANRFGMVRHGGPCMNFHDVILVRVNFLHLGIFPEVGDPEGSILNSQCYRCRQSIGRAALQCPRRRPASVGPLGSSTLRVPLIVMQSYYIIFVVKSGRECLFIVLQYFREWCYYEVLTTVHVGGHRKGA